MEEVEDETKKRDKGRAGLAMASKESEGCTASPTPEGQGKERESQRKWDVTGRDGRASLERPRIISLPYVGYPMMCTMLSARFLGTLCGPIAGISNSTRIILVVGSDRD